MKRIIPYFLILSLLFTGCYTTRPLEQEQLIMPVPSPAVPVETAPAQPEETYILLSEHGITVDGKDISTDSSQAVYAANDIVYYEAGHDFTYGEGSAEDEHTAEEAAAHTVVHITQPGAYRLSGTLPAGQVAVDLGEDAKDDPEAVVTLILDGVGIECTVAPAIIFYNVYECGDKDSSAAGANIIIAGSNAAPELTKYSELLGSHVARIYESFTLSEDGSEVTDSQTLHKYDGAVYSCMSMNISAEDGTGQSRLYIRGDNDGLGSKMHLTINGGTVNVSAVHSGLDADNGVYINGGTVTAMGNRLAPIEGSQNCAVFSFAQQQRDFSGSCTLKNEAGEVVFETYLPESFSNMLISSPALIPGTYTLWCNDIQLGGIAAAEDVTIIPVPGAGEAPQPPDDGFNRVPPEHSDGFVGIAPSDGFQDGLELPGGWVEYYIPAGLSGEFVIKDGVNFFTSVRILPLG